MKPDEAPIDYELRLAATEAATGFFGAVPREEPAEAAALEYARSRPNDEFMRRHLLHRIRGWDDAKLRAAAAGAENSDPFLLALLWEACLFRACSRSWVLPLPPEALASLSARTPSVYMRAHLQEDQALHTQWIHYFRQNILEHRPLPPPDAVDLPPPFAAMDPEALLEPRLTLKAMVDNLHPESREPRPPAMSAAEVHLLALERLSRAGVSLGGEMRHTASLSPIALLRSWRMQTTVSLGRHHFSLSGELTAYGRGVDFEAARAACAMEVVERCSAFGSFVEKGPTGYAAIPGIVHGRRSELGKGRSEVLDPNDLALEAPYRDEPLYWIEAVEQTPQGARPLLVPAQCAFLFCNLDEIKLFSALGSTGLGAGVSTAGARLSALTEVVERDCEGTSPFDPARCFEIETREPRLAALLESYRAEGIHLLFQDITPPYGFPCCKCFVTGLDGRIAKGTGAHLNARRALLAAMTETPFAYPGGPPSRPVPEGLTRVPVEALPDYSTGDPERDLEMAEQLLMANGFRVIYADLTRSDLELPVVRAIVPGMEALADFDRFSRVHPRLYANYLRTGRPR